MRSKLVDRLIVGAVVGSNSEPASRAGTVACRGKLDRGWPEGLFVLAERAGTMACRGKLDWGWPKRLFVLAEGAGTALIEPSTRAPGSAGQATLSNFDID